VSRHGGGRAKGKALRPIAEICPPCDQGNCARCFKLVHGQDVCVHPCRALTDDEKRDVSSLIVEAAQQAVTAEGLKYIDARSLTRALETMRNRDAHLVEQVAARRDAQLGRCPLHGVRPGDPLAAGVRCNGRSRACRTEES
jgi:hypothetical protein